MPGEAKDDIERGMAAYQWYHTLELGGGVVTPGQYDHRTVLSHYGLPARVDGKTVIDVGPAQGFFAFEFEKRGAARVVTVELPAWSSHDAGANLKTKFGPEHDRQAESYLHGALAFAIQARASKVERQFGNIYDLHPEPSACSTWRSAVRSSYTSPTPCARWPPSAA